METLVIKKNQPDFIKMKNATSFDKINEINKNKISNKNCYKIVENTRFQENYQQQICCSAHKMHVFSLNYNSIQFRSIPQVFNFQVSHTSKLYKSPVSVFGHWNRDPKYKYLSYRTMISVKKKEEKYIYYLILNASKQQQRNQ